MGNHKLKTSMDANIVIVDDMPDNLRVLMGILIDQGYRLRPVSKALRALAMIREERPDLILLDIKMPEMSGYDVCEQLQADERTRDIPVIFISALQELSEKVKGFAIGGVDYITKPFQAEEVLARVETHLSLSRLRQQLEEIVKTRTTALQKSEQQYRLLIEQVTDGIGIFQEDVLVFANEKLGSLLGMSQTHLLGKTMEELFGCESLNTAGTTRFQPECKHMTSPWERAECLVVQNERERWFERLQSTIVWEGGLGTLTTLHDVTDRKRKEQELHQKGRRLRRENARLRSVMRERYRFGKIIGRSQAMQEVYELVTKASVTDVNVVVYGESGTGKDLIAQTIHEMSPRRKHTYVPVNCGSIPETMFEREFFGHRKGAFTGALRDHPGFFDAAHHGTLFLDEIGELNLAMQVKLLRALESKGFTPVGEQRVKQADVRIVAATHRNLQEHVKQGMIREDFFYRINVIPITVPPLRKRREDIPLLIDHFLRQYDAQKAQEGLPGNIAEALYTYDWPGNIRQLQNVLLRYLTLQRLDLEETDHGRISSNTPEVEQQGLWNAVQDLEKRLILDALEQNRGHKTNTAKTLQIPIQTLRRKILQYEIE